MTEWLRAYWPKIAAGLAIAAVAAVAGLISYTHIENLTLALHQSLMVARLMPVGVDGLVTVGSVVLLQAEPGERWLGWLGIGPGVAISLFANVESGIRFGWLSATWAGIPALSFFLATFMLERWLKAQSAALAAAPVPVSASIAEIEPVPAKPVSPVASATDSTTPKATQKAPKTRHTGASRPDIERRAKAVLARQPQISGAELGRAVGASARTGQRLLANLNGGG